jgi:hypothetical protein
VAEGEALLAPSVTRRLIADFAVRTKRTGPNTAADALKVLTDRERRSSAWSRSGCRTRRSLIGSSSAP